MNSITGLLNTKLKIQYTTENNDVDQFSQFLIGSLFARLVSVGIAETSIIKIEWLTPAFKQITESTHDHVCVCGITNCALVQTKSNQTV